jgi:hypothetical protein
MVCDILHKKTYSIKVQPITNILTGNLRMFFQVRTETWENTVNTEQNSSQIIPVTVDTASRFT